MSKTKQENKPWTTPKGTKYTWIDESHGHVRVQVDFIVDLKRLLLFEEYCSITGNFFPSLVTEAIWEKMDNTIRNADVQEIGKYIKDEYMEKWDFNRKNKIGLQAPVDDGRWFD